MNKSQKQTLLVFLLVAVVITIFDISSLDNLFYQFFCHLINNIFPTVCVNYYDLPYWEVLVAIGTLSAAYFAFAGINEANKRLELEQAPYVVFSDRISISAPQNRLHIISVKNAGKGRAMNITASADTKEKNSIIDGSNPHSINLRDGEVHNNWAIDEARVIEGLSLAGVSIKHVMSDIPDENSLEKSKRYLSDLYLYLWYDDQLGNHYCTTGKFRHSGHFMKLMENTVRKVR